MASAIGARLEDGAKSHQNSSISVIARGNRKARDQTQGAKKHRALCERSRLPPEFPDFLTLSAYEQLD